MPAKPQRTWPALLALYVIAPIIGEVFSLNTPILTLLFHPGSFIFIPALYGSGAILVREIARRRGLGWGNILLLGAAYGVLEEGIDVQSWFNAHWTGIGTLGSYGRLWETNWVWALGLTVFHAVFSISIPIVLAERAFPAIATRPWLGRRGVVAFAALLTFTCLFGFVGNGFFLFRSVGYTHPPLQILFAVALMLAFFTLGLRWHPSAPRPSQRLAPRLWTVRLTAFGLALAYFIAFYGVAAAQPFALVAMAAVLGVVGFAWWRVRSWSARGGWDDRQVLALATGALGLGFVISPLAIATFLPVVALVFLIFVIWLARRTAQPVGPDPRAMRT
jgi:hypothetical protein